MNTMTRRGSLAALLTVALSLTGCAFLQSHTREVQALAYAAASIGTSTTLIARPDYRPRFEYAVAALKPLVEAEAISGAQLREILAGLPVRELSSPTARIVTDNVTMLFDLLTGEPVDLKEAPVVLAAAQGILKGMEAALAATKK